MGRSSLGKTMVVLILFGLLVWPVVQVYNWVHSKQEKHEAAHLLYQVSLFQMELLKGILHEANQMRATKELDSLKQALYSANYTHERLVLAVGSDKLAPMSSIPQLMQIILRLQIGGERGLQPGEQRILQEAGAHFEKLFAPYQKLMTSNGEVVSSQKDKLSEADEAFKEWLQKKQLE